MTLGRLPLAATVTVGVTARELFALPLDLPRYTAIEPMLRSARWLDPAPPRPGSQAELVAEIPFSIAAVRRAVGEQRAVVSIIELDAPRTLAFELETPRLTGLLEASFSDTAAGCIVRASGWLLPRRRVLRSALASGRPILARLADRSLARGLRRAADGLGDPACRTETGADNRPPRRPGAPGL
jgi:hypothetical protein